MDNITLIGMPGSGKSTAGVILAKRMNYDFIDGDLLIQKATGMKLIDIITKRGVDGFIELENDILSSIDVNRTIIATGGSAVYEPEAMENFKSSGKVIYIKVSFDEIVRRITNFETRGIPMRDGYSFLDLYNERVPLYEKYADFTIEGDNSSIEDVVYGIMDLM